MQRSCHPSDQRDVSKDYLDDIADRIPHVWLPDGRTSTLDLLGDGLLVLAGPGAQVPLPAPAPALAIPVVVHVLDPATADALQLGADGIMLVRPDGRPIARWDASADAAITTSAAISALGAALRAHSPAPDRKAHVLAQT